MKVYEVLGYFFRGRKRKFCSISSTPLDWYFVV